MTATAENPILALPEFGITPLAGVDTTSVLDLLGVPVPNPMSAPSLLA